MHVATATRHIFLFITQFIRTESKVAIAVKRLFVVVEGGGSVAIYNQYASLSIDQQRQRLPIFSYRNHILYLLETHQVKGALCVHAAMLDILI